MALNIKSIKINNYIYLLKKFNRVFKAVDIYKKSCVFRLFLSVDNYIFPQNISTAIIHRTNKRVFHSLSTKLICGKLAFLLFFRCF